MSETRFSIDTNILIYSIDTDAGLKHDAACRLMDALADKDCVLTLQALAEFFHAVTRKKKMPVEEAAAMAKDWMELFPVVVADGRALRGAMRLKEEASFSFWDAMIVETTRAAGVTRLLTEDLQDGRVLGTLHIENPFKDGFDLDLA
ncbi:PilT domain-containing protein [Thiorhodococcus drewsii AZ1]|uniref:PilT domain-containing protein n=1 Tax=Thiorhodococcus drewsii AZ1 TaxID=765913 RepID=G2E4M5_9GAMM|nr:PIN domain-containing protein [Thiorhodococcus drewsii]EGV29646.1 PilT domain-containing protein [Thiorhodococcus drewsii AZ1]